MHQVVRSLLMGICLALSSSAFASGFYLGGGGGYQNVKVNGYSLSLPVFGTINTPAVSGGGGVGLAFIGYEFAGDTFALGIETNIQPADINVASTSVGSTQFKTSWGANVRPGIFLTPNVKVFGAFGWQQARLQLRHSIDTSRSKTETIDGLYFGAGTEFIFPIGGVDSSSSVGLRLEYAHVDYSLSTPFSHTRTDGVLASVVWRFS